MKINSISIKIPTRKISNDFILETISIQNKDHNLNEVEEYKRTVSLLLKIAGSEIRYYRDPEKNETVLNLVSETMNEALLKANLTKDKIDLLIFCSVSKGFIEPANAYFFANSLGIQCECFDISDACMGWVRSLQVAQLYLNEKKYNNIMIINSEFPAYNLGFPEVFKIANSDQINYTFPSYTVGEAASATIVSKSSDIWQFDFTSCPQYAELCTIPLKGYEEFKENKNDYVLKDTNRFYSFGKDLFRIAEKEMIPLIKKNVKNISQTDIWFPHAASTKFSEQISAKLGFAEKLYNKVFQKYGNLASASLPVALYLAEKDGVLSRGKKVILCPGSAGMVFALVKFTF